MANKKVKTLFVVGLLMLNMVNAGYAQDLGGGRPIPLKVVSHVYVEARNIEITESTKALE